MTGRVARIAYLVTGLVFVVLGVLGAVLPVLPTTPFLLVSLWAFSKSSARLERWLLEHPRHGPAIRRWRDHRAVPRRAKWMASAMMLLSTAVIALSSAPSAAKLGVPAIMFVVAVWLWRRPEA